MGGCGRLARHFGSREGAEKTPSPSRGGLGWGWGCQGSEVRGQESERRGAIYRALFVLTRRRGENSPLPQAGEGHQTPVGFADTPFQKGAFFSAPSRLRVRLFFVLFVAFVFFVVKNKRAGLKPAPTCAERRTFFCVLCVLCG